MIGQFLAVFMTYDSIVKLALNEDAQYSVFRSKLSPLGCGYTMRDS